MKNTLPLSSFPLHGLLTIQLYYIPAVIVIEFILVLFKTYNLPYSSSMSAQEGIILLLFSFLMTFRTSQGIAANKTQDSLSMVGFIFMTLFAIVFSIYYLFLQYYVLQIEVILFVVLLVGNVMDLTFGFFSCWQFQSYEKQQ